MADTSIIYISGAGRSGSTLLDIMLGFEEGVQSIGELNFFVSNGISLNEYCSCGKRVHDCEVWSKIYQEWNNNRRLSDIDYLRAQRRVLRNKRTFSNIKEYIIPNKLHKDFIHDTKQLYLAIFKIHKTKVIVDSSKNSQNLLILKKLGISFKIIHLTRKFSGVLNSTNKSFKKNSKKGVEREIKPQSFNYSFMIWVVDNLLTIFFSIGYGRIRIRYEKLIASPENELSKIFNLNDSTRTVLKDRGPFKPDHLVAGNKLRMSSSIFIHEKSESNKLSLNPIQAALTRLADRF